MAKLINPFWTAVAPDTDHFKMEITTIGAAESFTFPFADAGTYTDCTINFGDGGGDFTITSYDDADRINEYTDEDTYTITISGTDWGGINFNNALPDLRVDDITQWGINAVSFLNFYGCSNMVITATDIPDLSNLTSFASFVRDCSSVVTIPNIGSWDTSTITIMGGMFSGATSFASVDLSSWDVSNVTSFSAMFLNADAFNHSGIGSWTLRSAGGINMSNMFFGNGLFNQALTWDMSKVTRIDSMFYLSVFNHVSIASWDVSNVTLFSSAFRENTAFAQDLSSWTTTSATSFLSTFWGANNFDSDISGWDFSNVTTAQNMFILNTGFDNGGQPLTNLDFSSCANFISMFNAGIFDQSVSGWTLKGSGTINMINMFKDSSFDQSLATWDVTYVNNYTSFMTNGALSTANYDATLIAWELLDLSDNETVDFGGSTYSDPGAGATAKAAIETDDNWTFIDGGGV